MVIMLVLVLGAFVCVVYVSFEKLCFVSLYESFPLFCV